MDTIDQHREKMRLLQRLRGQVVLSQEVTASPCGKYRLELTELGHEQKGNTHYYRVIVVREEENGQLADFFTDTDDKYFAWLKSQGRDFLLFAELEGGQTVVDLQGGKLLSFHDPDDEFIWTDFHLSPSGLRLAVGGCFWACPWDIRVYDFSRPSDGPLPVLAHFQSTGGEHLSFEKWLDEERFVASDAQGRHTFELGAITPR